MTDVNAGDDCTNTAPSTPTHNAALGLLAAENSCSWVSEPMMSSQRWRT